MYLVWLCDVLTASTADRTLKRVTETCWPRVHK